MVVLGSMCKHGEIPVFKSENQNPFYKFQKEGLTTGNQVLQNYWKGWGRGKTPGWGCSLQVKKSHAGAPG